MKTIDHDLLIASRALVIQRPISEEPRRVPYCLRFERRSDVRLRNGAACTCCGKRCAQRGVYNVYRWRGAWRLMSGNKWSFQDPVDLQRETIFNLNMDLVLRRRCARFVASIVRLPVDQLYASNGFYDAQPAALWITRTGRSCRDRSR